MLRALTGLDPDRRCYRSIGGVLVERTVKEVQPAVEKNLKGVTDYNSKVIAHLSHHIVIVDARLKMSLLR